MTAAQPIVYTSDPQWWRRLAATLGFTAVTDEDPVWNVVAAGGFWAVHAVEQGDPKDGTTELHYLVDDLDAAARSLGGAGASIERVTLDDVGPMVLATAESAVTLSVTEDAGQAEGNPSVLPIWYQDDLSQPSAILESLGLRRRVWSDAQTWIDFAAPGGGLTALHQGDRARVEFSLEYPGDLDELRTKLAESGFDSDIVDEAYNRTLLVAVPGRDALWINGVQTDLYGYQRAEGAVTS